MKARHLSIDLEWVRERYIKEPLEIASIEPRFLLYLAAKARFNRFTVLKTPSGKVVQPSVRKVVTVTPFRMMPHSRRKNSKSPFHQADRRPNMYGLETREGSPPALLSTANNPPARL